MKNPANAGFFLSTFFVPNEQLKHVFNIDTSVCPFCDDALRVIAGVTAPEVIQTILKHPNHSEASEAASTSG